MVVRQASSSQSRRPPPPKQDPKLPTSPTKDTSALSDANIQNGPTESECEADHLNTMPLVSPTAEDLLKQRFLHAQKRSSSNTLMKGGSGGPKDMPSFFRGRHASGDDTKKLQTSPVPKSSSTTVTNEPDETSLMGMRTPTSSPSHARLDEDKQVAEKQGNGVESAFADDMVGPIPAFQTPALAPIRRSDLSRLPDQPFDSHAFVRRLEDGGWCARASKLVSSSSSTSTKRGSHDSVETASIATPRRHDPAEAIMDITRALLREDGKRLLNEHINRSDVDNQLYLFSSALAELRTEVRVRARNDAAALRSITLLLEREIDGLTQKLQSDIEQLKHDIQVEMNSRKTEVQEESNNLEQDIQDLNNRFMIFLSDLKTEIEQSIKWDATRRALALVFGIVAIMVCTLALADYFTRPPAPSEEGVDDGNGAHDGHVATAAKARSLHMARVPVDHHTLDDDDAPPLLPPKSAEEWGLLPRYDADEVRHV